MLVIICDNNLMSSTKAGNEELSRNCPYLDTIDRTVLDFDFEKQCSVTLSHLNVYACLVCGKFYQGLYNVKYLYISTKPNIM